MPSKNLETLDGPTTAQWREWLMGHHDTESEVWLVFYKPQSGKTSIAYLDALDEALCFGWIDSLIKRLDDQRYARKFTPRKPGSRWSEINRKRYTLLKEAGRLAPPGINRPPTERTYGAKPVVPSKVPSYIQTALRQNPKAASYFENLAPSHRKRYVLWIDSAKQEATRTRRLEEAIRMLSAGRPLGLK
ncbi:MAG TPA: YdeI/OmpD-associated family protein [Terriglobia bacterium]|jgi:uncharacterized protein YdeI (YjbR/CyaY-like superfamily)